MKRTGIKIKKNKDSSFSLSFLQRHIKKFLFLFILICIGTWNVWKPLPSEINKAWSTRALSSADVVFLTDTTYINEKGEKVISQHIFDEVVNMIHSSNSYILVDMFLWNDFLGGGTTTNRRLAQELTNELVQKKKENPAMTIEVITDPINISYYGGTSKFFDEMQKQGIRVTFTNLSELRDSNPTLSALWRIFVQPLDFLYVYFFNSHYTFRIFPNIINAGGENVTLRSFLTLLNFKANHRKLIVTDIISDGKVDFVSLVTSANPHDGSSSHSNVAIKIRGNIGRDIISSENEVIKFSGNEVSLPFKDTEITSMGDISVQLITESAIKDTVVSLIQKTKEGDTVDLLMFYLSDRNIIQELINAGLRGVTVRIILDPNKDAFGREKNGIPNRETADSLIKKGGGNITIRWCGTHGEQCHGKMLVVKSQESYSMVLGSANYTRRNIGGYNLETDIFVSGKSSYQAWDEAFHYFDTLWKNEGLLFSVDYIIYKDESIFKKVISWIMENSGLGTF